MNWSLLIISLFIVHQGCSGGSDSKDQGAFCETVADCMLGLVCANNICSLPEENPCQPACTQAQACFEGACVEVVDNGDKDRDGSPHDEDCDDEDRSVHPEAFEICDGLDNNCDGRVDEGCAPCDAGEVQDCGDSVGTCSTGTQTCLGGSWQACTATRPGVEICDEQDNDCDGLEDEDCPCFEGQKQECGFDGQGCAQGTQECVEGAWSECLNGVLPAEERCDGVDNDCDGLIDEGYQTQTSCLTPGECGPGVLECAGDHETRCSSGPGGSQDAATAELCNGMDDDCDGETDEDYADVNDACDGDDTDLCKNGLWACTADGRGLVCGAEALTDIVEICNDQDDDCNGQVDDGFGVGLECIGLGGCGDGVGRVECAGIDNVRCSTNPGGSDFEPREEVCDGVDNDCDGETDEDFPLLSIPCDGPDDADLCENGQWTCRADGSGVECVNEDPFNVTERCNSFDDDCDGEIDEDFPEVFNQTPCDDNDDGCFNGRFTCSGEFSFTCTGDTNFSVETCNGADDNCNGIIDEGIDADLDGFSDCNHHYFTNPSSWDCCSSNADAHAGADFQSNDMHCEVLFDSLPYEYQANFENSGGAQWDWDCNGIIERDRGTELASFTVIIGCILITPGWLYTAPVCGETRQWVTGFPLFSCIPNGPVYTIKCK